MRSSAGAHPANRTPTPQDAAGDVDGEGPPGAGCMRGGRLGARSTMLEGFSGSDREEFLAADQGRVRASGRVSARFALAV